MPQSALFITKITTCSGAERRRVGLNCRCGGWDGAGYPARLRGDAILLSRRIVAVADAFDAMTHTRPHQPARPFAAAVVELRRERGRQFDPAVVDGLLAVLARDCLLA